MCSAWWSGSPDATAADDPGDVVRLPRSDSVVWYDGRRIEFAEAWRSARTLDYNVSLIILDVDDEGRGEGQLMLGAEFTWNEDKNQVEITHFASEPIRLRNVRLR